MHLMNRGYFDYKKKPKDPQFKPHAGIKVAQVLGSMVYIYSIVVDAGTVGVYHN